MWNTKKMAVLLGGLMLAGAFQTVQAKVEPIFQTSPPTGLDG